MRHPTRREAQAQHIADRLLLHRASERSDLPHAHAAELAADDARSLAHQHLREGAYNDASRAFRAAANLTITAHIARRLDPDSIETRTRRVHPRLTIGQAA